MNIPFNKPYITGKEVHYIYQAVFSGKLSGNGIFSQRCQRFFEENMHFKKCLLTNSCTDALEMAAILCNLKPGDEVIIPSYTFVSTANPFILQGAKIVFADSRKDHPGLDEYAIERLITPKTKVIVPVHYAGVACDMDTIMELAHKYDLLVVEDAAQAIDSYYTGRDGSKRALGSFGHFAAFSFHETKNIISGEGGMLVINDDKYAKRAEIIWEKGTNRSAFFRGEVDKYGWVDVGSSFLPSEVTAAFLWAQLENIDDIQNTRHNIHNRYMNGLRDWADAYRVKVPFIPPFASNNAHMFYLVMSSGSAREKLINALKQANIHAVFHYLSLHSSSYYQDKHDGRILPNSDLYSDCLVRLPMYYELTENQQLEVINTITSIDI